MIYYVQKLVTFAHTVFIRVEDKSTAEGVEGLTPANFTPKMYNPDGSDVTSDFTISPPSELSRGFYKVVISGVAASMYKILGTYLLSESYSGTEDVFDSWAYIISTGHNMLDLTGVSTQLTSIASVLNTHETAQATHRTALTNHEIAQATHRNYMTGQAGKDIALTVQEFDSLADLQIFRGDKKLISFAITDNGSALNLTGATIKLAAKEDRKDASLYFDKTVTITDAVNGLCEVLLTATETAKVTSVIAELEITWADASKSTYGDFMIRFKPDIRTS